MALRLVQYGTIGDGKTLCCSVDVVVEMLKEVEWCAAHDARLELLEALTGKLTSDGVVVAKAALAASRRSVDLRDAAIVAARAASKNGAAS